MTGECTNTPTQHTETGSGNSGYARQNAVADEIQVSACGDRRALEAFYLELRELAKRHKLEVEYELSRKA